MRYAQIDRGMKLHLVYDPGEGASPDKLTPAGRVSAPLCGCPAFHGHYRLTINVPLGAACQTCRRVDAARRSK